MVFPMANTDFWTIVEATATGASVNRSNQVHKIRQILKKCSLDEIAAFKRQQNSEMKAACTFGLMVAAFVVYSRLSDDLFLDFRSWLILHGREMFHGAIKNPDNVVKLVRKRDVGRINEAGFFDLPLGLWLDRGGGALVYAKKVGIFKEKKVKTNWPATVTDFKQRYPILFGSFWNAGRIKSFQS
jgi:hypothetical protein